ncbi:AvaI/BsoBI family type II restriction endonuclease [[Limnothrix rosea] IAM M-220]|uniref:AvaI/BsoBI family type II restriction endonuclease n=1 Tax=[Limnothrix rosea] IAM M-220 TaxID=454133 RepID=UPI00095A93C8|nr:AvaI/BsoBI family type II restriction endonuclease [[Limnothrix rosea] IAM M-220]OKH18895.1 type II site-specific deoxyribonuclease [[Limnothrix rosea] IAM M-220]
MKNNQFVSNSDDLVTTRDARRSGFLEYALRRNKESLPFIDKAKALRVSLENETKCAEDILQLADLRDTLIEAAGVSVKAKAHLDDTDKTEILAGFVKEVLAPCGNKYIDELIYRYLLTLGDALGGRMRNIVGSIAEEKFVRFIIAQLRIHNIEFELFPKRSKWISSTDYVAGMAARTKALRWTKNTSHRSMIFNINVPQVKKNIDIVLLDDKIDGVTSSILANTLNDAQNYLAIGELKGGIDPAGADEHWKTANTALGRVRDSFKTKVQLFFIGAAIENSMSSEIYGQCQKGELSNAANLTVDNQLSALCEWLITQ